jgi:hypothetical protein
MTEFEAFVNQHDTVNMYFPKLILKGIHEPDFDSSIISFSKCKIDNLIIEDIDITTAFYPISFSECNIGNVSIINGRVRRAKIKDFYSSWNIFGINFYKTRIKESFIIEGFESNMMARRCYGKEVLGAGDWRLGYLSGF